ncbi:sodium:proton antiporter [Halococcus sp. IIIV-5B]|uniref:cation:proton antiporter n=1 Tax=Halococcus sp. IIIV-5B TaxID=2321230 RepID=UPI000E72D7EB|nr:sodium:proton antiporter [Halococcus sp. IIIV-5B]RJS98619.1 sodium:proton antiporter [Halococcus sp. IIIV-5B]
MLAQTVAATEVDLLVVFMLAAGVGVFVAKVGRFPYTIALLIGGFAVSGIQAVFGVQLFDIELSHDLILLVLLPPLLFEGAATTDLESFRANIGPILALAVPGVILSVIVLGLVGQYAFGFPLLVSLLFAAMILPTDPVSVLALFDELGAPERLSTLVEGESLLNDGVGVVIFSALLALTEESLRTNTPASELLSLSRLASTAFEIALSSVGGVVVGLVAGYAVYRVMVNLDEHMTEIVLTLILTYGSFLLAEHYLHVSGVIATVVAGLFIGNRGVEYAMSPQTKLSIFNTLETAAFIVNTFIFVAIGATTPVRQLAEFAVPIVVAIPLVLLARVVAVYPLTAITNRFTPNGVPRNYQHVMVWGGLHGSIPVALVLGLPSGFPPGNELRAMVFGVVAFSLVVQGLTMSRLLDRLGIATRSDDQRLYELLNGRARATDAALDAAERLRKRGDIPSDVYDDFTEEYEEEREDLRDAISQLMQENPDLRREELLIGERRLLQREKNAIREAVQNGVIGGDVGDRLLEEVDLKLNRVNDGESTVDEQEEAYEEFWRTQAAEFGLDIDPPGEGTTD